MAEKYKNFISKYNLTYGIVAERDCSIGKSVKYAIKTLFPRLTHLSVRKLVNGCSFFLAMGKSGVRCYKRYGVKESVLYNYMYNVAHTYISPKPYKKGETIRFIYIGRFDFLIKGVDVLIKATEKLNGNFVLDLVGGYGKNRDEVLNQIKTSSNINFLGTWDNKTICEKLNDYDVIIIPSNMDGWNLHNNYAVLSGVGSITSNQSGSDELVENCKNGIVFKAGNVKRLTKAMQSVLENPDVINRWKNNTQDYFSKISAESVSDYLVNIINYAVFGIGETKPIEPWHVKE